MTYTNYLQEQFKQLQSDPKFEEMMLTNQACLLQLWILEVQTESSVSLRLLYCWILPNTFANGKWSKTDVVLNWKPNTKAYKANIFKYSFYAEGVTISSLIEELIQGTSISELCTKLNLSHPHKRLEPFTLGNPRAIAQNYAIRPTIFLETETSLSRFQDVSKPMKSPSKYTSTLSASIVFLQKLRIWESDTLSTISLDDADALARMSIMELRKETGFSFNGSDSSRLGNIEWFAFPLSDRETVPADFSPIKSDIKIPNSNGLTITKKSSREVDVYLNKGPAISCPFLLVHCRLYNHHNVTMDQVRLVHLKEAKRGIRFTANQEISRVRLTIWIPSEEKRNWTIWFEQEASLMRQMNMAMGTTGLQGKVKLTTLQGVTTNSAQVKERIKHFEQVSQTNYQQSTIGDYSLDPWVSASRQIQDYVNGLFPPASKGRFFPKGWGHDGPGVLSFAEWFRSLTNRTTHQLITIVDPYFDTVGVELIAHSLTTNTAFEIITSTQTNSKDDVTESSRLQRIIGLLPFFRKRKNSKQDQKQHSEPNRAMRILKACSDLRLVLSRLNLAIWDIRSEHGGNSSLFHDRYILIFDGNGNVMEGYHLSNSIQAATKFDPMLVTPIPADILGEVASYVVQVANAESPAVEKATAIQLYPRNNTENTVEKPMEKEQNLVLRTNLFWVELLPKDELATASIPQIAEHLEANGFLDADRECFIIEDEELMAKWLQNLAINLQDMERDKFLIVWEQFSVWLANVPGSEVYLEKLCEYSNQKLGQVLHNYLLGSVWPSFEEIKVDQELLFQRYFSYFQSDYKGSLDDSFYYLDGRFDRYLSGHFHLKYAAKALLSIEPGFMIDVLETLEKRLKHDEEPDHRDAIIISYLLHELVAYLMFEPHKEVIKRLLLSSVSVLRALGSQAEWFSKLGALDIPSLSELNPIERLFAYAEWIYHIRVQANRRGETEELKKVRLGIFQLIIQNWQADLTEYDKSSLINRLCGPSKGSWASDIYEELMIPLVQADMLSSDEAILFWMELLIEKLEGKGSFHLQTDQPLTELCAKLYSKLSEPALKKVEKRIQKRITVVNREFRRPFAKSNNFEIWNEAKLTGIWIAIFLKLALMYGASNELKALLETIDKQLQDYTDISNEGLAIFAEKHS
ncbi:VPA1262 family protein [Peribacillus frigoritolerans]|uniref:VPA1262 family protein n=1 Tax=Peribacillus frigoritolerans TaxID=450367 RepID=UPI0025A24C72|nr:VPA1262 family protein [Peribacillus frigoritolerans]MDM5310338.1 VPA1262 family protein [Peribacillus frigoritolerans]